MYWHCMNALVMNEDHVGAVDTSRLHILVAHWVAVGHEMRAGVRCSAGDFMGLSQLVAGRWRVRYGTNTEYPRGIVCQ